MRDKTEKPTAFKLKKAKEQGQVAKSLELNTMLALIVFFELLLARWQQILNDLIDIFKKTFIMSAQFFYSEGHIIRLFDWIWSALLPLWGLFALAMLVVIIVSTIGQIGFVWTFKPLLFDFSRLNPIKGWKRLFSQRLLFELFKSFLKPVLVFCVASIQFYFSLPLIITLIYLPINKSIFLVIPLILKNLLQIILTLTVIAGIDLAYIRWKYVKDQRMTKQEIKDEYRQREGHPKIKQRIKQLQQQLLAKISSMRNIKHADVIVTNPTSFAIALKYERGLMPAPKIVCKGQGEQAKLILKIARRFNVAIIEHKPLARALFKQVQQNDWIKSHHFAMAAEVFREVYRMEVV